MKNYKIDSIDYVDGYERIATIEDIVTNNRITVHFLEFDEYLNCGEVSEVKKVGDIVKGNISIDLITSSQFTDDDINHYYPDIIGSSWVNAIVKVTRIVDGYSLYAISSIIDEEILVEFETIVNYQIGDKILIKGSLEFEES